MKLLSAKTLCLSACLFFAFQFISLSASAQCQGRYYDKVFPNPDITSVVPILGEIPNFGTLPDHLVVYGSAEGETLDMYVVEPEGDTAAKRPLIVLAFGGSFTAGVKESPDLIKLCSEFTQRGFVTVSIKYRILPGSATLDSATVLKQVIKAVQDAKGAIRYFYKDAATTNIYRIDTNKIFMGGTSAGAFIGVHLGYVTDTLSTPTWLNQIITSVGDLEGTSGSPGYSSRIAGVINLAGAVGDTAWINPGEVPMVSMQGNDDGTVPYCSDSARVPGSGGLIVVDGCGIIKRRTANLGIVNRFYTWRGADHVPYVDPRPTTSGPAYMDTTVWFVRDFLYEQITGHRCDSTLWAAGNETTPYIYVNGTPEPCGSEITDPLDAKPFYNANSTGITPLNLNNSFSVYPNPSNDVVNIERRTSFKGEASIEVYNVDGRMVQSFGSIGSKISISKKDVGAGLFIVKIVPQDKNIAAARTTIIFQ